MKKFILTFAFLIGLGLSGAPLMAQQEITIGQGDTVSSELPIHLLNCYGYYQLIYTADEITEAGAPSGSYTIRSISFYAMPTTTTATPQRYLNIYLGHTFRSDLTEGWVGNGVFTKVFQGDVAIPPVEGWITILLNIPFEYNGTDNLAITIDDNTTSWDNSRDFKADITEEARGMYVHRDNYDFDFYSQGSFSGTATHERPIIALNRQTSAGIRSLEATAPLRLYPNPTTEILHISGLEPGSHVAVIYNVLGQKVKEVSLTGEEADIDVSQLPAGSYTLTERDNPRKASQFEIRK